MAYTDYPFFFAEISTVQGSYAGLDDVQRFMMSYQIDNDRVTSPEQSGARDIINFLLQTSAEIDAVLLSRGALVPPPSTAPILSILRQYCAFGAVALIEHQRFETGDDSIGNHATAMLNLYANGLGMLEHEDFDLGLMGCVTAGWLATHNRKQRYFSGNLLANADGTPKVPQFTMTMPW